MRYNYEYKGLIALVEVLSERRNLVPSDAALALPIPPKVRSHDAAHTIASLGYVFFFGTPLPLRGGFPPKKEVFRLSYHNEFLHCLRIYYPSQYAYFMRA